MANAMPHITRTLPLIGFAAVCAVACPALAGTSPQPQTAAWNTTVGGSTAAVTVGFTVRPVVVVVVDADGSPTQLWTNIPGTPTAAELDAVQARLDSPRGGPVAIDPALRAQIANILSAADWGHQGLIWQRT